MKKCVLFISFVLLLLLLSGCKKEKVNSENTKVTLTPTSLPVVTLPPENVADQNTDGIDSGQVENQQKLLEYYPIQADVEYIYEGKGNEYASYKVYTDFLDSVNNKVQTRTNNGGSETVRVIQIKGGKVSIIYSMNECYYRENFIDKTSTKKPEILLMEPLVKGTQWTLPDGRKRYISAVDVKVDTPSGIYKAIEVTTEGKGDNTKDYYAPKAGLVKSVFNSGGTKISSSLSKINTNTQLKQKIAVYYPDSDEKMHQESLTLAFRTGDVIRTVLEKALKQEAVKKSYLPLLSANTVINSLYLGKDKIVYVDFSKDFTEEMNLGSGFEALVLQCITNTLGNYYGVDKVYITIAGKPYESGHILMKKGETFKVNMDSLVK